MEKQTAVELLFRLYMDKKGSLTQSDFEKALSLEKEQIKHAVIWGDLYESSDAYYEQTYE